MGGTFYTLNGTVDTNVGPTAEVGPAPMPMATSSDGQIPATATYKFPPSVLVGKWSHPPADGCGAPIYHTFEAYPDNENTVILKILGQPPMCCCTCFQPPLDLNRDAPWADTFTASEYRGGVWKINVIDENTVKMRVVRGAGNSNLRTCRKLKRTNVLASGVSGQAMQR